MSKALLLDTCAAIWLMKGSPMSERSLHAIDAAARDDAVHVSPFTAWEIAMLDAAGRSPIGAKPSEWYGALVNLAGVQELPLNAQTLIAAWQLPGKLHRDPADRILIATAREHRLVLVTRDRAILEYGQASHISVLEC